tara:strand:+ start:59043 stop:59711 length:669 start_codon:yes stop_codon:yes gene_type:complete
MKQFFFSIFIVFTLLYSTPTAKAQTVQLLAGNTLNGAMNGTLLGGASMAITNNSDDFYPLQVGLGLGTLYGIGMGGYDIVKGGGKEILVSGLFNDGNNSSIIVLLDTFYGAAAGSIIVTSVMLVANRPLIDGLQYGAGIGAWVGFGFGLFDTFILAKTATSPLAKLYQPTNNANGIVGLDLNNGTSLGFMNPSILQTIELTPTSFNRSFSPSVELVNVKISF